MTTEVSVMNEVLRRVVALEKLVAELDDRAANPDTAATDQAAADADQAATALADHAQRLGQLESAIGSALVEAADHAQHRLEAMHQTHLEALTAAADANPAASVTKVVRDPDGRVSAALRVDRTTPR